MIFIAEENNGSAKRLDSFGVSSSLFITPIWTLLYVFGKEVHLIKGKTRVSVALSFTVKI